VKNKWIIGIDEVGRGPVAGPVAVCGCAIREFDYKRSIWKGLNDSKKLSPKTRELWYKEAIKLKTSGKINFSVAYRSNAFIDKYGISLALKKCIEEALKNLKLNSKDCKVLLDGSLKAPKEYLNQKTIIKGDQKEKIISMASVIAKVSRDKKMEILHKKYPKYNWFKNKGYGTREHYKAIGSQGITTLHRKTFLKKL
jgi:ribonuclease HII